MNGHEDPFDNRLSNQTFTRYVSEAKKAQGGRLVQSYERAKLIQPEPMINIEPASI